MFPSIEPSEVGVTGLIWLVLTYGYVLFYASNLISEGSDLLLLVPSMAGFVGGTVLPLLGAVPDGAILLFSGLGDRKTAQDTLSVGVGALAGSTIMLLTVPWSLSVFNGRVDLVGPYRTPNYKATPKLTTTGLVKTLRHTGVSLTDQVRHGAVVMMITTIPYFLIQVPASIYTSNGNATLEDISEEESVWALTGFIICVVGFISYLWFQVHTSEKSAEKMKRIAVMKKYVHDGVVSLSATMADAFKDAELESTVRRYSEYQRLLATGIEHPPPDVQADLSELLREVFRKYDRDRNGTLDKTEVMEVLHDLNENVSEARLDQLFEKFDVDHDGTVSFQEFISAIWVIMLDRKMRGEETSIENLADVEAEEDGEPNEDGVEADSAYSEDESETMQKRRASLTPEEQQRSIKRQAFLYLSVGTVLVVLFSDPMVDVLAEIAKQINVSPFYVSFILAPLASNASEIIASQYYAAKKTRKTMTVSLTALEGAASMNNTFCLSILLGLIYFRRLVWEFTAETISILAVEFAVGLTAARKSTMTVLQGFAIMSLFPVSIALVAVLEAFGLD